MRTCPECGKDTEAGMAEPCTKCGFSPLGGDAVEEAPAFEPIGEPVGTTDDGEWADPELAELARLEAEDAAATADPVAEPESGQTVAKAKRKGRVQLIIWALVGFGIWLAFQNFDAFDTPPGPTADEVEDALVASAAKFGVTVTAECPDDAEDTEVGDSFECMVTSSDGKRITLAVDNNEDDFSWRTGPLARLGH